MQLVWRVWLVKDDREAPCSCHHSEAPMEVLDSMNVLRMPLDALSSSYHRTPKIEKSPSGLSGRLCGEFRLFLLMLRYSVSVYLPRLYWRWSSAISTLAFPDDTEVPGKKQPLLCNDFSVRLFCQHYSRL